MTTGKRVDKAALVREVIARLESDLTVLKAAQAQTYDAATNEESRPENQYDTRALESSYLSAAQAKRVLDVEAALTTFRFMSPRPFGEEDPIGPTALVRLKGKNRESLAWIVAAGGGLVLPLAIGSVQLVTPKSPLGEALQGLHVGEIAMIDKENETLEYEILSVE